MLLIISAGITLQAIPAKSRNLDGVISRGSYQPKLLYISQQVRK